MTEKERIALRYKVSTVFTPTSPIDKFDLFAGRRPQVNKIFSAVGQKGEHVIVYGERGVGKTSLANVLSEGLAGLGAQGLNAVKVNCDVRTNFTDLWQRILRELQLGELVRNPQKAEEDQFSLDFPYKLISPDDIRYTLQSILGTTIIIIDEVDRIRDPQTTALLADTIKALSDHNVPTTLILVGVADSVNEIITDHKSVGRALVQIPMPRMSVLELSEILNKSLNKVNMSIDPVATHRVTTLSQGLPHYTHLLGLISAEHAVDRDSAKVEWVDVQEAIKNAVERTSQSNINNYLKATSSSQKGNLYAQVLLACALTQTDELGRFSAADVREPLCEITGKSYDIPAFARHLNAFCTEDRGSILQKTRDPKRHRYRFEDPQMRPFVTMSGLAKGLLDEDSWRMLSGMN